jgi:hypothetical protein
MYEEPSLQPNYSIVKWEYTETNGNIHKAQCVTNHHSNLIIALGNGNIHK